MIVSLQGKMSVKSSGFFLFVCLQFLVCFKQSFTKHIFIKIIKTVKKKVRVNALFHIHYLEEMIAKGVSNYFYQNSSIRLYEAKFY